MLKTEAPAARFLLTQLVAAAFPRATVVAASMARDASLSEPTSKLFVHFRAGRVKCRFAQRRRRSLHSRLERSVDVSLRSEPLSDDRTVRPVAFASENCPLGDMSCPAGATASGGCFNPTDSSCQDGLICPAPLRICRRDSIGPGACFYSGQFIGDLGRLRGLSAPPPTHRDV